jgi:16S rRNA (guanine527-N7)-methyltransferase
VKAIPRKEPVRFEDLTPLKIYAKGIGLELEEWQIEKFYEFTQELFEWNNKINLTSLKNLEEILIHHYLDSIVPGPYLVGIKTLMDIATGAGFPGIPLKILRPEIELYLVEAKRKRISFLRNLTMRLSLENVHLFHGRAEDKEVLRNFRENIDAVITRASLKSEQVLKIGYWIIKKGGKILIMKGDLSLKEMREIESFVEKSESQGKEIISYMLPGMTKKRNLIIITK